MPIKSQLILLLSFIAAIKCQTTNVCNSNDCNYGTCEVVSSTDYLCHCNSGITGSNCNVRDTSGQPCASNPCYGQGSSCVNLNSTNYACLCAAGRTGQNCKSTLSVSSTCPCQNGGLCVPKSATLPIYECACPTNYGGLLCEYSIQAFQGCQVTPCQNGGTCLITSKCKCPSNYAGNLCQYSSLTTTAAAVNQNNGQYIALCSPGICLNSGTCVQVTNNLARCVCVSGFYGIYCNLGASTTSTSTTSTSTTSTSTTSTSTTSTSTTSTSTTTSTTSTTTSTTTTSTTSTTSTSTTTSTTSTTSTTTTTAANVKCPSGITSPCLNGGTCTYNTQTGVIQCQCATGYSGFFCSNQAPFCDSKPCQNGGTCVSTGTYTGQCNCLTGFTGTYCQVGLTCSPNPCQNGQQCLTSNGVAFCLCTGNLSPPYCT